MTRRLGRNLLILPTLVVVLGGIGLGPAVASACDDGTVSLSCTGLIPAPAPEPVPEPEPSPAPQPAPQPAPEPQPAPDAPASGEIETDAHAVDRLRSLIGAERRAHGLGGLASRADLAEVAAVHSRAMADRGELWHNDDLFSPATKDRLGLRLVGENVAANVSIDDAHRRLMASAGHRANLLSASFVQLGIGVARAGNTWFITEVFATPVSPRAGGRPSTVAPATSPSGVRPASAPRPPAVATGGPGTSAPAAAGGSVVAAHLEVPRPASAAPSSLGSARPAPVRSAPTRSPVLVAIALLVVVLACVLLVPDLRSTLKTRKTAALATFRAWTRRPLPLHAAVGPRPRRLGAR